MENAVKQEQPEQVISDELRAEVIESEEYMEKHQDEWITSEKFFANLENI